VASHLTIQSGTQANLVTRAFGGTAGAQPEGSEGGDLLGLFAGLLGNGGTQASATSEASARLAVGGTEIDLKTLLAGLGEGGDDEGGQPGADILAGVASLVTSTVPVDSKPMLDFIEDLGTLKASLHRGEALDPALLAEVEKSLDTLAGALGVDLSALPVAADFGALLEAEADATGLAGTLSRLLGSLGEALAPGIDIASKAGTERPLNTDLLKSLGDKLGTLLAALENGDVAAEKLAAIGLPVDGEAVAEIEEALARFLTGGKNPAQTVPDAPELAAPVLKPTETVLGKSAEGADPADTPALSAADRLAEAARGDAADQGGEQRSRDRPEPVRIEPNKPERQAAPIIAAATATVDASAMVNAASGTDGAQVKIDAVATPRVIQAGYQTSQQQLNLPQIAFELARQMDGGNTRFQIRLDPPELGRIDVRLEIDQGGQVNARLTVEKAETLDLMQRDQRALERALQQAGIDQNKTNLEFSLKQNPFAGQQGQEDRDGRPGTQGEVTGGAAVSEAEPTPPTVNLYRGSLQASGVNIIA
jgi:flagellar hook-length control protein FliK